MKKTLGVILLTLMVILLFLINYSFLDKAIQGFLIQREPVLVNRVIDGDTVEINNKTSLRLLGINSPERNEPYYNEAKSFLEDSILNKTVYLEFGKERYDKYGRILGYIFLDNKNINLRIVEEGFANYYFYSGRDMYSGDLEDAWGECIENQINLCEPSSDICASCILLTQDSITNSCSFSCDISDWQIKGEGREKFIFPEKMLRPEEKAYFELDLTNSGGSLFLRDKEGKLMLWKS